MKMPNNQFSPYDPHHVTLQLLQEVHSIRIQMQMDRDAEREKNRRLIEQHQRQLDELHTELHAKQNRIEELEIRVVELLDRRTKHEDPPNT